MEKLLANIIKKTIQTTYNYGVLLKTDSGEEITPDSIISLKIPTYELTKNTFFEGSIPRFFITFSPEEAYEITMTVQENAGYYADGGLTKQLTIREFISKQLRKVINYGGSHNTPSDYINKKQPIIVSINDMNDDPLCIINFRNWAFVKGQQTQDFGYVEESAVTFDLVFAFEYYTIEFLDKAVEF
jgi:hypothetical protein